MCKSGVSPTRIGELVWDVLIAEKAGGFTLPPEEVNGNTAE